MQLMIVTGMSGAGKSKAINALEDIGYYCVDNLPPQFLPELVHLCHTREDARICWQSLYFSGSWRSCGSKRSRHKKRIYSFVYLPQRLAG